MRAREQGLCLPGPVLHAVPMFHMCPLTQASQNLVVLAREGAGAEKIFRSNGVQLLQRLLDTGETDLMLAALRTLVGICSEHQSRVGEGCSYCFSPSICPSIHPSTLILFQKKSLKAAYKETCREMKNLKFRLKHDLGQTGARKEQSHPLIPEHLLSCSCSRTPLVTDSLTVRVVKASLVLRAGHLSFPDNLMCISPECGGSSW